MCNLYFLFHILFPLGLALLLKGIKGIGEKTASDLIQKFGSIEDIYKKLRKDKKQFEKAGIKERIIGLLVEGEEEAKFSKMLGTIRLDAQIDFTLPEKTWKENIDSEKVISVWSDLEFRTLGARFKDILNPKTKVQNQKVDIKNDEPKSTGSNTGLFANDKDNKKTKELSIMLWLINSNQSKNILIRWL